MKRKVGVYDENFIPYFTVETISPSPASGERRARSGYRGQDKVSADLMYSNILNGTLEFIRVADPFAGRVDDFQIGTQSHIDAYQVKWSRVQGNFTFNNLISPEENKPSLLFQLVDGWVRIQRHNPIFRVRVHLITNDNISTRDRPYGIGLSFKKFYEEVWMSIKIGSIGSETIPTQWQSHWDDLIQKTQLKESDLVLFIKNSELHFNFKGSIPNDDYLKKRYEKDIQTIVNTLYSLIAESDKVEYSFEEMVKILGWNNRFGGKIIHRFLGPNPNIIYYPIKKTINEIENKINHALGGYICLLGPAGSGKSTLLSKLRPKKDQRFINYYVYSNLPLRDNSSTGESSVFLNFIVNEIKKYGIGKETALSSEERVDLIAEFNQKLSDLHDNWRNTGIKTIIFIDGIDHIAREQNPVTELMKDLPEPSHIPEGVVFVLGSQTDSDFLSSIKAQLEETENTLDISKLDIEHRKKIIVESIPQELDDEIINLISTKSEGHPLSLVYLIEEIKGSNGDRSNMEVANNMLYGGDPNRRYYSLWDDVIGRNSQLIEIFGIMCRVRGSIDIDWMANYVDFSHFWQLRDQYKHFFNRKDDKWRFLHNSFKQFLIKMTASPGGNYDKKTNSSFYKILYNYSSKTTPKHVQHQEQLYYLIQSGKSQDVKEFISQEWFRNQYKQLKPLSLINEEIKGAFRLLKTDPDLLALVKLLLTGTEMSLRGYHLDNTDLILTLIDLDYNDQAVRLLESEELDIFNNAIQKVKIFEICFRLLPNTEYSVVRDVFEHYESSQMLFSDKIIEFDHETIELLEKWASYAPYFREIEDILSIIRSRNFKAQIKTQQGNLTDNQFTRLIQSKMIYSLVRTMIFEKRIIQVKEVLDCLNLRWNSDKEVWFLIHRDLWNHFYHENRLEDAKIWLNKFQKRKLLKLEEKYYLDLIEGKFLIENDVKLLDLKNFPNKLELLNPAYLESQNQTIYKLRMKLFKLINICLKRNGNNHQDHFFESLFGSEVKYSVNDLGKYYFERSLFKLSEIWVEGFLTERQDVSINNSQIENIIDFFSIDYSKSRDWHDWHTISGLTKFYFDLLFQCFQYHNTTEVLMQIFTTRWEDKVQQVYWPVTLRRFIIMKLFNEGAGRSWTISQLEKLETIMFTDQDVSGKIAECREQIKVLTIMNKRENALKVLNLLLNISSGVGYRKDLQLNEWIKSIQFTNNFENSLTKSWIEKFAGIIYNIKDSVENRTIKSAMNELIDVSFQYNPKLSLELFVWGYNNELLWYEDSLVTILQNICKTIENQTEPLVFLTNHFVLPIFNNPFPSFLECIVKRQFEIGGQESLISTAQNFIEGVKIYPIESKRYEWIKGIKILPNTVGIQHHSLDFSNFQFPQRSGASSSEFYSDNSGNIFDRNDIIELIKSGADLNLIFKNEKEASYFDWKHVINYISNNPDSLSIKFDDLKDIVKASGNELLYLIAIANSTLEKGDMETAWEQILDCIRMHEYYQWFDGNSIYSLFSKLVEIDRDKAFILFMNMFIDNLLSHFYPQNSVFKINQIISLFEEQIDISSFLDEINDYVDNLNQDVPIQQKKSFKSDLNKTSIDDELLIELLIDFTLENIHNYSTPIAYSSRRVLVHFILNLNSNNYLIDRINSLLLENERILESILIVLDITFRLNRDATQPFISKLKKLVNSNNLYISQTSFSIVSHFDSQIPIPHFQEFSIFNPFQDLLFYPHGLSVSNFHALFDEPIINKTKYAPFIPDFETLSLFSHVPESFILHHVYKLIFDLSSSDIWNGNLEKKIIRLMRSSGLRFNFNRPRTSYLRLSLFHILKDILSYTHPSIHVQILNWYPFYDPDFFLIESEPRPNFITLSDIKNTEKETEFFQKFSNAYAELQVDNISQDIVIAEQTCVMSLNRSYFIETKYSTFTKVKLANVKLESMFFTLKDISISDYLLLKVPISKLVVRFTSSRLYEQELQQILALNPYIAKQLNWEYDETGLFRWRDKDNNIMVQTIVWQDGALHHKNEIELSQSVTGGSYVVVSLTAFNDLKIKFGYDWLLNLFQRHKGDYHIVEKISYIKLPNH